VARCEKTTEPLSPLPPVPVPPKCEVKAAFDPKDGNYRYRDMSKTVSHLKKGVCRSGTDVMIFFNIFAKIFWEKIGVFDSKQS
jgi:hypothetical protein